MCWYKIREHSYSILMTWDQTSGRHWQGADEVGRWHVFSHRHGWQHRHVWCRQHMLGPCSPLQRCRGRASLAQHCGLGDTGAACTQHQHGGQYSRDSITSLSQSQDKSMSMYKTSNLDRHTGFKAYNADNLCAPSSIHLCHWTQPTKSITIRTTGMPFTGFLKSEPESAGCSLTFLYIKINTFTMNS